MSRTGAPRPHLLEIDDLRGIAITLTLIAHVNLAFVQPIPWMTALYGGAEFWGGVYLFFVISGYVITRGFWDQCADPDRRFLDVARVFYGRRACRIALPAWFWIGCTLVCAALFDVEGVMGDLRRDLIQAAAAATFTYNLIFPLWSAAFGIYWSLTFEEQFYLCFPVLARLDWRLRTVALLLPIVVLAAVRRPAGTFLVFVPVDALCWGVLLGLAERAGLLARIEPRLLRRPLARALSLAASLLALVLIPSWLKPVAPATSLMTLACVWLVFCASFDAGYARPGRAEWLRRLGTASFSVYLCHGLAFLLAREIGILWRHRWGGDAAWLNAGSIGLGRGATAPCAAVAFRAGETPARRGGRRGGRRAAAAGGPGAVLAPPPRGRGLTGPSVRWAASVLWRANGGPARRGGLTRP